MSVYIEISYETILVYVWVESQCHRIKSYIMQPVHDSKAWLVRVESKLVETFSTSYQIIRRLLYGCVQETNNIFSNHLVRAKVSRSKIFSEPVVINRPQRCRPTNAFVYKLHVVESPDNRTILYAML